MPLGRSLIAQGGPLLEHGLMCQLMYMIVKAKAIADTTANPGQPYKDDP